MPFIKVGLLQDSGVRLNEFQPGGAKQTTECTCGFQKFRITKKHLPAEILCKSAATTETHCQIT